MRIKEKMLVDRYVVQICDICGAKQHLNPEKYELTTDEVCSIYEIGGYFSKGIGDGIVLEIDVCHSCLIKALTLLAGEETIKKFTRETNND